MNKEEILYNGLGIYNYELKTHTLKGEKLEELSKGVKYD